jgi:hypothetical protein
MRTVKKEKSRRIMSLDFLRWICMLHYRYFAVTLTGFLYTCNYGRYNARAI